MKRTDFILAAVIFFSVALIATSNFKKISRDTAGKTSQKEEEQSITADELATFRSSIVTQEQAIEEIRLKPQTVPPSVMEFAEASNNLMDKGLKDEGIANLLIKEFHNCAINGFAFITIRALCVSNAEKLTTSFPTLKIWSDEIRTSVPKEVLDLADARKLTPQKK